VLLQEALRLRESKAVDEVVAVSLGPQQVQVGIRTRHAASMACAAHSRTKWTLSAVTRGQYY
jgi:electron transfer flavoprotein alpha/beta subunit